MSALPAGNALGMKSELSFGRNGGLKHLAKSGENGLEFGIVTLFHFIDLVAALPESSGEI
jgi:hypothetical protein